MKLVLAILALGISSGAQSSDIVKVAVEHSGNDQVGRQLAFELKEAIRGSNSFVLFDSFESPALRLHIVTLDHDDPPKGEASSIGVTIVVDGLELPLYGHFLAQYIQICGSNRVAGCARSYLGDIDKAAEDLKKQAPELYRKTVVQSSR